MRNILVFMMLMFSTVVISAQSKNILLDADFWKKNPDVAAVKAEIIKGNDPAELNANAFDPVVLAINNSAPNATILYLLEQKGNPVYKITHDSRIYLHWAAYKGNTELMEFLLAKGSDINLEDSHGNPPAAFAAGSGQTNTKTYDLLFKQGISPKKKYKDGANLLLLGIQNDKNLALTDYFIGQGLSLTQTDDAGNTAFDYAARGGNVEQLKILRQKGIPATGHALFTAAQGLRRQSNTIDVFKYLIEEVKLDPGSKNKQGETALHLLVKKQNQLDIINYLISKGVDPNIADNNGNTLLMNAASGAEAAVIEKLISKSKNINLVNNKGQSALTYAVSGGSAGSVSLLLNNGAYANLKDRDGNNLMFYLINSYKSMKPGSPEEQDFDNKLSLLKTSGVEVSAAQKDGNTLYHLAVMKNGVPLLKKLEIMKPDINSKNNEGLTALHKAAMMASDDTILKYLLSLGADKKLTTEFDETAYDLASENEALGRNKISIEFLK